jgi:ribosomal protein S18 acetylase RimI-like enzyme
MSEQLGQESTMTRAVVLRAARSADVPAIAEIHCASFPGFFVTLLGPAFCRAYYGLVLQYDKGILHVVEVAGVPAGFVAGFLDPASFYRTMRRSMWRFAFPILRAVLTRPAVIRRVLGSVVRISASRGESESLAPTSCELAGIALLPAHARQGLGKSLVAQFLSCAQKMGASRVYLTTDARSNDAVNGFYRSLGFQVTREVRRTGSRIMNEYGLLLRPDRAGGP